MKKIISRLFKVLCLVLLITKVHANIDVVNDIDTNAIQKQSRRVKRKYTKSPTVLAAYLTKDLKDEPSKIIAITYWITKNIKYDYGAFLSNTLKRHSSKEILNRRIALCGEYAQLFNEMCESVGIKTSTISGYVHEFDFFPGDTLYRAEHAWSTVFVNNKWELMDLTFGAGHLEPKRQFFKNLMWLFFQKPYEVEWHYVHAYNPYWFYVNPSEMVASHLPILDFFQFLDKPISIEEFNKGYDQTFKMQNSVKIAKQNSSEIKAYLAMGDHQKLDLECTQTKRINNNNNRLVGFNNYLIFNDLYSKYYNPESKEIEASEKELKRMQSIKQLAVENLKESINNNNLEYDHYERRSIAWLDSLNNSNKQYISSNKQRIKLNKNQLKSIKRIDKKTVIYAKSTNKAVKKFKRFNIDKTRRPKPDKESTAIALAHIARKDSLMCDLFNFTYIIDSLFGRYNKEDQNLMASTEKSATSAHFQNRKLMFKHNLKKMIDYAFIYLDESLVNKPWLAKNFKNANELNLTNLDLLLNDLNVFLPQLKQNIKFDKNQTKTAVKALKSAKKNSISDLFEKQMCDSIINIYKDRMKLYSKAYDDFFHVKGKVEWWLKFSQRNLKKTQKLLKKDIILEKQRHKNYMAYRTSIQKSENYNMKFLIKQLNNMGQDFVEELPDVMVQKVPINNQKKLNISTNKSYSPNGTPSGKEDVPSSNLLEEMRFVEILNAERKKRGLTELIMDEDLCRASRYHSYDMGVQNYFEHATYDRNLVSGKLEYVCKTFQRIDKFGNSNAENIAAGNSSAESTYTQWYNSPGHYRNMFDKKWTRIGVGYVKVEGSPYSHYWTTDFGY
jgi:uncharacterized protein YkwD